MGALFGLLGMLVGLGAFVCLIVVLIKLFQEKGIVHAILGFICGLYTFIWGWMNADRLNIKTIMLIWTGLIVASIFLNVAVGLVSQ